MSELRSKNLSQIKKGEKKLIKEVQRKKQKEKMLMTDDVKRKNYIKQLGKYMDSPFQGDRMYAISFIASECRDDMLNQEEIVT